MSFPIQNPKSKFQNRTTIVATPTHRYNSLPMALEVGIVGLPNVGKSTGGPLREIATLDAALALADLETVSSSLDKSERLARSGDKEAIARAEVLRKCKTQLNDAKPVRQLVFDADDAKMLKSLGLIT